MDKYRILVKGIVQCQDHYLVVEKWYDDRIFVIKWKRNDFRDTGKGCTARGGRKDRIVGSGR